MKEKALLWQAQVAAGKFIFCKRKLKEHYTEKYKTMIRICDILIICAILFNFGAVAITNALVVKNEPDKKFHEVNPVGRETFDYAPPPEDAGGKDITLVWRALIIHTLLLLVLLGVYLTLRFGVNSPYSMGLLMMCTFFLFILLGWDFSNDFGYWIGVQIWGI